MKLQKLLYYCQGMFIAGAGIPMFLERIEAWKHGPVVVDAWYELNWLDADDIPVNDVDGLSWMLRQLSDYQTTILQWVFQQYGHYSAGDLRDRSHNEPPWKEAYAKGGLGAEITLVSLKKYFKQFFR